MSTSTPQGSFESGRASQAAQQMANAARGSVENVKEGVTDAIERGRAGIAGSAQQAGESLSDDVARLRADMARLQETLGKLVGQVGSEAAKTVSSVRQTVA